MFEKSGLGNQLHHKDALWQAYRNIYFAWRSPPLEIASFAILTAFNPESQLLADQTNQLAQQKLSARANALTGCYALIDAGNRDFSYLEPSLAIPCHLSQAVNLAHEFVQNAFYWVEDQQLWLIPVLLSDRERLCLGRFSARVIQQPTSHE